MNQHQQPWNKETILQVFREENHPLLADVYGHFKSEIIEFYKRKNSGLDDSELEDIYQDSFLVVYKKAEDSDFKFEVSFKSYLWKTYNNLFLKRLRKKKNFDKITDVIDKVHYGEVRDIEKEIELVDELKLVMKHLEELDEPCKKVIKSFYLEGKSLESIATELDFTNKGSAKVKRFKCLKKLVTMVMDDLNSINNNTKKNEETATS